MKSDVANIDSGSQRHAKGLNPSVKVLVVQRIFIVPDAGSWIAHLVTHKPDAIVPRIGLELVHGGADTCPGHNGRLHSHSGANRRKCHIGWGIDDRELAIGYIVVHVALAGMRLAP